MKTRLSILLICVILALSGCITNDDFNHLRESGKTILLQRMDEPEIFEKEQTIAEFDVHAKKRI